MHGSLEKVCPHTSTGRADYFGTTVNRAARLLSATKPGQILVEAPVMETVLQQWRQNASRSGSAGTTAANSEASAGSTRTKGAAFLQAGAIAIPDIASDEADELVTSPRIKSAPELLHSFSQRQSQAGSASIRQPLNSTAAEKQTAASSMQPLNSTAAGAQTVALGHKSWFARHVPGQQSQQARRSDFCANWSKRSSIDGLVKVAWSAQIY